MDRKERKQIKYYFLHVTLMIRMFSKLLAEEKSINI